MCVGLFDYNYKYILINERKIFGADTRIVLIIMGSGRGDEDILFYI
jgi:hypothetical protein